MAKKAHQMIGVSVAILASMIAAHAQQYIPDNEPMGITASINQSQQIYISWSPPATSTNIVGYYLYRTGGLIANTAATYYMDVPPPGIYFYTVAAHDAAGNAFPQSSASPLVTFIMDRTPPSTPADISAIPSSSSTMLSWSPSTDDVGVIGYYIYRNGIKITTPNAITGTSYTDSGLSSGNAYTYSVLAYDAAGNISASPPLIRVTTIYDITPPSVPSGLSATATSPAEIDLVWKPSTDNIQVGGYNVYRDGSLIASVATTSYMDNGVSPQTSYTYSVAAYDTSDNVSLRSVVMQATTSAHDSAAPSVPARIAAMPISSSEVDLSWQPSSDNIAVEGFYVYQDGARIGSTASTTYAVSGLATSTTYQFVVTAYDAAGNVSPPTSAAAKTLSFVPAPGADPTMNGISPSSATIVSPSGLPPATGTVFFTATLSIGMRHNDVKKLQSFLIRKGYLAQDSATGYFGAFTQKAVQKFQCDQGIVCSGSPRTSGWGSVGSRTRKALNALYGTGQ